MSLSIENFAELKKKVAEASREAERAAGSRDQLLKELKREHGVTSLKEAKALLAKKTKERDARKEAIEKEIKAIEKEYGDELDL